MTYLEYFLKNKIVLDCIYENKKYLLKRYLAAFPLLFVTQVHPGLESIIDNITMQTVRIVLLL